MLVRSWFWRKHGPPDPSVYTDLDADGREVRRKQQAKAKPSYPFKTG